ncbi:MAG: NAD(P)H-dependent oxidoreductase [Acidobacteriota bacterium]
MKKILVLFAHPRTDRSEANVVLAEVPQRHPAVTFVDLYAEYPTFEIDVEREQERLREHDVLVFHHPVYWYSSPAILKEWQDLVLEYGFAYGSEGRALEGKLFVSAVTTGGRREVYCRTGVNRFELRELFAPFEQTMYLCRMRYLPPFALFAAGHARDEQRLDEHVRDYQRLLDALADDRLDVAGAADRLTLSDGLDELITPAAGAV